MSSEENIRERVDRLAVDLEKRLFNFDRGDILYDPQNHVEYEVVDHSLRLGRKEVQYELLDSISKDTTTEPVAKVDSRFIEVTACPSCGVVGYYDAGLFECLNPDCEIQEYGGDTKDKSEMTGGSQ